MRRLMHWLGHTVAGALFIAMGLAGCSSKESASQEAYMSHCNLALQDRKMCSCMYDELRADHTAEEIAKAATDVNLPSQEWQRAMVKVTLACLKR